jgi:hypothetical protein
MCTLRAVPKAHQQQSKEATYWASGPTYTTACLPDGRTRTQQVAKFPVSSSSHSGAGATQNRDWRWAPPPSPPRSMITAISSHNRLIPAVGMPLLSSHTYTIVVRGRKSICKLLEGIPLIP